MGDARRGASLGGDVTRNALILGGPLGSGHEMMARSCVGVLERSGWRTRTLDSMSLLGRRNSSIGRRLFRRLVGIPGLYDGLHFAHFRTGSRLADLMDEAAIARLVPSLRADLEQRPADLVISVFATGASAAAKLRAEAPGLRTVVLCTDVAVHRMWVREGTDLFMVTSPAAAESVRRYLPRATVSVIPPPVRAAFYDAPARQQAREALGIPPSEFCVLVIDSGWGFGPLVDSVRMLADAGIYVVAVAGRQRTVERQLRELARTRPQVLPYGFTDHVPELMAAADVVIALPGATTCSEARVVGRPLLLLDLMPGHGRDNLQHELELGGAHVCMATANGVAASVLALRNDVLAEQLEPDRAPRWEPAFKDALTGIGIDLSASVPAQGRPSLPADPAAMADRTPAKDA
jgi:processive 1,2-diacylglycerol beta-glucosyltransferase